jgi:hypothetical protein
MRKCHCSPTVDDAYIPIKNCANPYVTSFREKVKRRHLWKKGGFQSTTKYTRKFFSIIFLSPKFLCYIVNTC